MNKQIYGSLLIKTSIIDKTTETPPTKTNMMKPNSLSKLKFYCWPPSPRPQSAITITFIHHHKPLS